MIQADKLRLSFKDQIVFENISFNVNQTDRIGLVGRNGSGKTTLLSAILHPSILDSGTISIQKNKKIAYMPQEVVLESNLSILDETYTTFGNLYQIEQEASEIENILKNSSDEKLIERYLELQEKLSGSSPDELKAKTKKVLMGLGFSATQFDQPVSNLSVGWKMRIVLAKLLLQNADFYLFDEPTNHLDLIAKEWFLGFLKEAEFGFIIICHEKYFLDELCEKILELERGKATLYSGNYSDYIVQKEHNLKLLEQAYAQQQKEIKRKEATIERFKASASKARMAQSMQKSLEKIDLIELPQSTKNVNFNFPPVQQSGKVAIKVTNLSQKFGEKLIFKNVSFEIERNQKAAIIAPNGVGKTTLFNIITGALPLQHGNITLGHNVQYAIFAQDQNKVLNKNLTIIENLREICPKVTEQKIRSFLGAFLFSGDDVNKKVGVLSGGEKNRVGMVSVLLQQANLLFLDEPTNHLDIPSKEILLKALQEFNGTLLFVSHDRDFINDLATDILELTPNGVNNYKGNYDEYLYYKKSINPEIEPNQNLNIKNPAKTSIKTIEKNKSDSQKQLRVVEEKISKLEQQIEKVNQSFAEVEYGTEEFNLIVNKLKRLQKELEDFENQWEELQKF